MPVYREPSSLSSQHPTLAPGLSRHLPCPRPKSPTPPQGPSASLLQARLPNPPPESQTPRLGTSPTAACPQTQLSIPCVSCANKYMCFASP